MTGENKPMNKEDLNFKEIREKTEAADQFIRRIAIVMEQNKEPAIFVAPENPTEEERERARISRIQHNTWKEETTAQMDDIIDEFSARYPILEKDIYRKVMELFTGYGLKAIDEPLEVIKSRFPDKATFPIDKVTNELFQNGFSERVVEVLVTGKKTGKNKKEARVSVSLDYDAMEAQTTGIQNLTEYDRAVYDAVVSLWASGNEYFTTQMLYQVMTGNPAARATESSRATIDQSLKRLMSRVVTISATEERKLNERESMKDSYFDNLLSLRGRVKAINGERVDCYQIKDPPVLYDYASAAHHVATADPDMLNAPFHKDEKGIALTNYLKRRVAILPQKKKKTGNNMNKIRYDTLFAVIGLEKSREKRYRGYVKNTLEDWKKKGYIADYAEYSTGSGKRIDGVQITPSTNRNKLTAAGEKE